ncbi:MAG TPA: DEAD/DEAH box helicase, partial [Thermotogota bacterium]|nr:DEAD/DEAH box helicase [Thermotogota bacterium]
MIDPANTQFVVDLSPMFRRSRLYIESLLRRRTPSGNALRVGHKAAMNVMDYQLEPAFHALARPRQRILLADGVGLGKTLEAGVLMSELIARGKGKRILVVALKSMMLQLQKELWTRFTIPLKRLDSRGIQRIRAHIPSNHNPFYYYDNVIISIDTLKNDHEYRTMLEKTRWDIIAIDEAHNVARRGKSQAQRSRLAELLSKRSDTLILLSATPHDGRPRSFASLMNMLEPTAIANEEDYRREDIQGMVFRRFKKDVQSQVSAHFKERAIRRETCDASEQEEAFFDLFEPLRFSWADRARGETMLFKTLLEKSVFSSPLACKKTALARIAKLEKEGRSESVSDIRALRGLVANLETITPDRFSRYQRLLDLLNSPDYGWNRELPDDRLVIFTERIETMKFLADHLKDDLNLRDDQILRLYGGMSDVDQQAAVDEFGA